MATIKSALVLNDRMTSVLKRINTALDTTLDAFEAVQKATGKTFDSSKIAKARSEIGKAGAELRSMEDEYKKLNDEQDRLNAGLSKGGRLARTLVGAFSVKKVADFVSGSLAAFGTQSRAEAQLGTVLSNTGASPEAGGALQQKAASLQGKTMFGDEAMLGAAGEFATYMNDPKAIGVMMDTLANYAAGMSGGEAVDYSQMIDYATNLGKIMTGSFDAMTKKGFEFTEEQKKIIETGTDMEKALVISDVINESWDGLAERMANTPTGKIQQIKNLLGDVQEEVGARLVPAIMLLMGTILANSDIISEILLGAAEVIGYIIEILAWLLEGAAAIYNFFAENWSQIGPILTGVAVALGIITAAIIAYKVWTLIAAAAQRLLNAAMFASPLTWILVIIIAVIAAIVGIATWIAKATGVAQSGFGVITGGLAVVWAAIKNTGLLVADIGLGIWEVLGAVVHNIYAAFHNAIASIKSWFYGLLSTVLNVVAGIAAALNKIPFISFDYSGVTNAANEYAAKAAEAEGSKEEYTSLSDAFDKGFNTFDAFQDGWASQAFESGAAWGDGVAQSVSDMFTMDSFTAPDAGSYASSPAGADLGEIADNTGATAENTAKTNEELSYLRDIAEKEAINRFTTAEILVDMSGMTNRIDSDLDLDGVISYLTDGLEEALVTAAEGVY